MNTVNFSRLPITVLVITVLLAVSIGATGVSAQTADGEVAVSPTEVSLEQGESQTIAITYNRESDATPQGIEYALAYDPAIISVTDQEQGSYLGGTAFVNNVSTSGEVEYVEAILDGDGVETASGTVATITIEAANDVDAGATTTLEFTTAKASEGATEFTITTTNGTVETEASDQTDGSTDEDSDTEDTTEDNSDNEETTNEDATNEETAADGAEASNNETTSKEDNTATTNETTTEAELNEAENTETDQSTETEQAATDSSTDETSKSEEDTSGAAPGFGIKLVAISILIISYIIGHQKY